MGEIEQQLRDFIVTTFMFGRGEDLRSNDSFLEKGIIDSTGILELVSFLEQTYGLTVNDDELVPDNLDSIDALLQFIGRKRPQPASEQSAAACC